VTSKLSAPSVGFGTAGFQQRHISGLSTVCCKQNKRHLTRTLVRSPKSSFSPELTELGFLNDNHELHVPSTTEGASRCPLGFHFADFWIFPFHEICWKLLQVYLGEEASPHQVAYHLYNLLYCVTLNKRYILVPQHDYGGIPPILRQPYRYVLYTMHTNQEYSALLEYPMGAFSQESLSRTGHSIIPEFQYGQAGSRLSEKSSPFGALPAEITMEIIVLLSTADLCTRRLLRGKSRI
jgi:hypothetical protein